MKKEVSNSNGFYPDGYTLPDKAKQFMKMEVGENQFRILLPALMGFIVFEEVDGKFRPRRKLISDGDFTQEELDGMALKVDPETGEKEKPKHFWALLVWSRKHNAPKVVEITQSTIMKGIDALVKDEDWGDPRNYDIVISRVGTGKNDTEFSIKPKPAKQLEKEVIDILEGIDQKCNLAGLIEGSYPFTSYDYE